MEFPLCWGRGEGLVRPSPQRAFYALPRGPYLAFEVISPGYLFGLELCGIIPTSASQLASWGPPEWTTSQLGLWAGTEQAKASQFLRKPSCDGEGPWERNVAEGELTTLLCPEPQAGRATQ